MKTPTNIFLATMIIVFVTGYSVQHPAQEIKPITVKAYEVKQEVPVKAKTVQYPPIEEYIRLKFGVYGDTAMKLLTDPKCHENLKLDPGAINDNRTRGGIGRDRGIFQINDVFHPAVTDACAFDYKCNIDYAYRMFVNDNYSFKRWTCGRELGI